MATGPQQKRKELREKRLQAEASARNADKRQNLMKIVGIAAFLVVVGVIIAIVAVSSGGDDNGGGSSSGPASIEGIQQNGDTLGNANAPVTLVEFGDLQCPICRDYAEEVLPDVINGPVRDGTANIEFANWAILGPESILASKAALAAGEQDLMWSFIEQFYANQGLEGSGYVTDEFLTEVAEKAGIPDIDKWNADRESPAVENKLIEIDEEATNNGFTGTPSFAIREDDGSLTPIQNIQTAEALIQAINDADDSGNAGGAGGNAGNSGGAGGNAGNAAGNGQ